MNHQDAATKLEALGNPLRLAIFRALVRAGRPGLVVGAIQQKFDIPPSTLSHHIKILVNQGLIRQDRDGTHLICTAEFDVMQALVGYLSSECCRDEATPQ